ncbi:MAG: 50S ribosomal protein L6 [Planctomycetaceae bacterium]|jgi:large subunit ribosomal protein L6|nr:50S ribosomal protein L6 [Planctomycetaceae bacterium]
MSRVGKKPVIIPKGVKVVVADGVVKVEGPMGALEQSYKPEVKVTFDAASSSILVENATQTRLAAAMHGLYRALIQNMVIGVTQGYEKKLEIFGTGYLFAVQGKTLQVRAGFANEIHKAIPTGLTVAAPDQQHLTVKGIDKQLVGMFAAEVRAIRKAEPYLGKGIKYEGEVIRRKESKAATKK